MPEGISIGWELSKQDALEVSNEDPKDVNVKIVDKLSSGVTFIANVLPFGEEGKITLLEKS